MKKIKWGIIPILILMILLQGCKKVDLNIDGKMYPPEDISLSIKGVWVIKKYKALNNEYRENGVLQNYIGKTVVLCEDIALFDEEVCINPEYRFRKVNTQNFLLYKYKLNSRESDITNKEIDTVSVFSDKQLFYDFIKINDKELMVYYNNAFLYMSKLSDDTSSYLNKLDLENERSSYDKDWINEKKTVRTGILLGLRTSKASNLDGDGSNKSYNSKYRTIWISAENNVLGNNGKINKVLEIPQILVSRINGFWEVGVNTKTKDGKLVQNLFAYPISHSTSENLNDESKSQEIGEREIFFVGSDYIGTEYLTQKNLASKKPPILQVLPIDSISDGKGINISDVVTKENAREILVRSSQRFLAAQEEKASQLEQLPAENNFTLVRRNGHWIMKGRLNYYSPKESASFEDYNIYLMPPSTLINYDKLTIPWNKIKLRNPEVLDAYTSPSNDIAILVSRDYIYVYSIEKRLLNDILLDVNISRVPYNVLEKRVLNDIPLRKIKIDEGESVIMTQWTVGEDVEKWESVIKTRGTNVKEY